MEDKKRRQNILKEPTGGSGWLIKTLFLVLFVLIGVIGVVFYMIANQPEADYYALGPKHERQKLLALQNPIISPSRLLQWAHSIAIEAHSYNFVNYENALLQLKPNFTEDGWDYFRRALDSSKNLETVISKKLIASAVSTGTPVVLERSIVGGRFSWKIQIPLLVSYQNSANEQEQRPVIVMMIVSRVPTAEIPRGMAVVSFIETEGEVGR